MQTNLFYPYIMNPTKVKQNVIEIKISIKNGHAKMLNNHAEKEF